MLLILIEVINILYFELKMIHIIHYTLFHNSVNSYLIYKAKYTFICVCFSFIKFFFFFFFFFKKSFKQSFLPPPHKRGKKKKKLQKKKKKKKKNVMK